MDEGVRRDSLVPQRRRRCKASSRSTGTESGKAVFHLPPGYPLAPSFEKRGVEFAGIFDVDPKGAKILPVGIYSKNFKVRPFRKTYIVFGEIEEFSFPEDMGKKEQAIFVTDRIFERISVLEEKARRGCETKGKDWK